MSAIQEHIAGIDKQLHQLIKQYETLKAEQKAKDEQLRMLNVQLRSCQDELEKKEQENLILKASVTTMEAGDKKLLDQKIQHYIKNIDTCISLLSQ